MINSCETGFHAKTQFKYSNLKHEIIRKMQGDQLSMVRKKICLGLKKKIIKNLPASVLDLCLKDV